MVVTARERPTGRLMGVRVNVKRHGFLALQIAGEVRRNGSARSSVKRAESPDPGGSCRPHREGSASGRKLREALKARLLFEPDGPCRTMILYYPRSHARRPSAATTKYGFCAKAWRRDRVSAISKHRSYFENSSSPTCLKHFARYPNRSTPTRTPTSSAAR
jgi:hypothetical protein